MNTSGLLIGMEGCAVVFHLAAYTSPVSRDPSLPYRVNVTGSLNALKAAEECGVRKMIMCSTAGTLGYSPCGEILDKSSARYGIRGTEYEIKPIREGASVTISWLRSGLQSDEPF